MTAVARGADALALWAALAGSVALAAAPSPRAVEGFLSHRAVYDLKLKTVTWSSAMMNLSGRLVSEFDDACQGYTFNQRLVTDYTDPQGAALSANFWASSYESADGASFSFNSSNKIGETLERAQGVARRAPSGDVSVNFTKPATRDLALGANVSFPTVLMGRAVKVARDGGRSLSAQLFDGDAEGKVYDAFIAIGTQRAARPDELALPGGEALKGLKAWPMTLTYYERGAAEELPVYEASFAMFENGVSTDVTFDYGDFALEGRLLRIDGLPSPGC